MKTENKHLGATQYRDRHGKARWRFRRGGWSVPLKGCPGDPEFEYEYKAARDGIRPDRGLKTGSIYVIQGAPETAIKIGFTSYISISGRLAELQTGNPQALRVIAHAPAYRKFERLVHISLKQDRLSGEWFAWSPRTSAFVEALEVGMGRALDVILPDGLLV